MYIRSILFGCYGRGNKQLKLRLCSTANTMNLTPNIFLERDLEGFNTLENTISRSRAENCSFFLSLESISIGNVRVTTHAKEEERNIILCDVREHAIASNCLPEEVTGFWVRTFGPKQKFTLRVALWQVIHKEKRICHLKKESFSDDHVMKVNELKVEFENSDSKSKKPTKEKTKPKKLTKEKTRHVNPRCFPNIADCSDHQLTFCSKELYMQVTTCLRECIENGKFTVFSEKYEQFCQTLLGQKSTVHRDSIEFRLLLSCEMSQFHAYQGNYVEAKKVLQEVVVNVVAKSPNKTFFLNRAYLYLANVHLMEENCGLAEECLNMLQFKKNGSTFEDSTLFYVIYAVTLMTFSKKLPQMSDRLRTESFQTFLKAETYLQNSLPTSLNRLCWTLLQKARLFLCQHYSFCCSSNVNEAMECVKSVEKYGENLVSERNKCFLVIIKSEISFFQKDNDKAGELLNDAEHIASKFNFHQQKLLCETLRLQRLKLEEQLPPTAAIASASCSVSSKNGCRDIEMSCTVYDADESS